MLININFCTEKIKKCVMKSNIIKFIYIDKHYKINI